MSGSSGTLNFDRARLNDGFNHIFAAEQLARLKGAEGLPADEYSCSLANWLKMDDGTRKLWALSVYFSVSTIMTGAMGSASATKVSAASQVRALADREWVVAELAAWQGEPSGAIANLIESLSPAAEEAIGRMLPRELSDAERLAWASELAASIRR